MLKVERKNEFNFVVTGEGIDAQVWYIDKYDNSVKGKGSRKAKEEILQAVRNFIAAESEAKYQTKKAEVEAKRAEFINSFLYSNVELLALYNAELEYYYEQEGHWVKYNELMTGYELLNNNDVVNAEKAEIKNTDIYVIPVMPRMAHADERLILVNNEIYVTGLTLKEKLLTGLKSYGKIRKANSAEMRMLEELGNSNKTAFLLGSKPNLEKELEMAIRYNKEMQRAINTTEEPTQPKEFTPDGKEIKYAWFSSKVFDIEEIANKHMASLEKYVVAESITITKEQYEKFISSFEMSDLGVTFTGGTNSIYEPTEEAEDFYQLSEVEQAKWVAGAYNLALEVKIEGENFSLLIDPQGYSYARYIAIVGDYPTKKDTKNKNMSFEIVQTEEVTERTKEKQAPTNNNNSTQEKEHEQETFTFIPEVQENVFNLQFFSNPTNTDDILNLFDTIDLTQENSIISNEDREHINKLEESYRATLSVFENTLQQLKALYGQFGDDSKTYDSYSFVCRYNDIRDMEERINKLKDNFISKVCYYFINKYNVTIDYESICKKYDTTVTAQNILDEIIEQLDGFSFVEKAEQEIKQQLQKEITKNTEVKGNKLILSNFFYIDSFDLKWGDYKLSYNSYNRAETLLKALYLYEYNITQLTEEAEQLLKTLKYSKNNNVFTTHELHLNKIKSIKLYKNGRVDIEFASSHHAKEFAKEFLNIVKAA